MHGSSALAYYRRAMDRLEWVLGGIAGLCLAAFVAIVLVDVIFREVLVRPLLAPSELSVCLFIWSTMLAAAVAARRKAHFVIDFLPENLPRGLERLLGLCAVLGAVVFSLVLTWYGAEMAERGIGRRSPMSGFSMAMFFTAFPVAGLAFLLFSLEQLAQFLAGEPEGDRA